MNGFATRNTTQRTKTIESSTPGFTIRLEETTELSDALLIAEFDGGRYEPLGGVISIAEAKEIADSNMRCQVPRNIPAAD